MVSIGWYVLHKIRTAGGYQYSVKLKAPNGKVLAEADRVPTELQAREIIRLMQSDVLIQTTQTDVTHGFKVTTLNNVVLATGSRYKRAHERQDAVDAVLFHRTTTRVKETS
jgi:uncharacterized protein YegP (UPF0339 family)